jgi:hypothetical protein
MWSIIGKFIVKNWKYITFFVNALLRYTKIRKMGKIDENIEKIIDKVVEFADEKTNTGVIDPVDAPIMKLVLKNLWKLAAANGNPKLIDALEVFAQSIIEGDDEELIDLLSAYIDEEIDIPWLDDEEEKEFIIKFLSVVAYSIRSIVE